MLGIQLLDACVSRIPLVVCLPPGKSNSAVREGHHMYDTWDLKAMVLQISSGDRKAKHRNFPRLVHSTTQFLCHFSRQVHRKRGL